MSDVRLSWNLPELTSRQLRIAHIRVDFRVDDSLPWTEQDTVPADAVQELLFSDVAPGTYFYRVTVVDIADAEASNFVSADVAFDDPSAVVNLQAVVEG